MSNKDLITKRQIRVKMTRADSYTSEELEHNATFSHTGDKDMDRRLANEEIVVWRTIAELMQHHSEGSTWTFTYPQRDILFIYKTLEAHMDEIEEYLLRGGKADIATLATSQEHRDKIKGMYDKYSSFLKDLKSVYTRVVPEIKERQRFRMTGRDSRVLGKSKETGPVQIAKASSLKTNAKVKPWQQN